MNKILSTIIMVSALGMAQLAYSYDATQLMNTEPTYVVNARNTPLKASFYENQIVQEDKGTVVLLDGLEPNEEVRLELRSVTTKSQHIFKDNSRIIASSDGKASFIISYKDLSPGRWKLLIACLGESGGLLRIFEVKPRAALPAW